MTSSEGVGEERGGIHWKSNHKGLKTNKQINKQTNQSLSAQVEGFSLPQTNKLDEKEDLHSIFHVRMAEQSQNFSSRGGKLPVEKENKERRKKIKLKKKKKTLRVSNRS